MKNITQAFNEIYLPQKALLIYECLSANDKVYVEAYDMDESGRPVNAHPLSVTEIKSLADCLNQSDELRNDFLTPRSLLPANVLYIDPVRRGFAVWYTPASEAILHFKKELGIPSGKAHVPALVWKATRNSLNIYAIKTNKRPQENTLLYHAPFFNIYKDGNVCMGTVDIDIDSRCGLEDFITQWQDYFWNSSFSHLHEGYNPVSKNIVQLWHKQVMTEQLFSADVLKPNGQTLKDILR